MTDKDNTTVMISKKWASRLIAIATRNQRSNSGQLRHWIMTEDGLGGYEEDVSRDKGNDKN